LGHSPWLGLLGLPLTFGFSFYYGFVSFLLATPLVVFALLLALEHAANPGIWPGLGLGALLCVTLLAHGFALAISLLSVTALLAFGPLRSLPHRLAPLGAPIALGLLWLGPAAQQAALYDYSIRPGRSVQWLSMILGPGSFRDIGALALGVAIASLVLSSLGRFSQAPGRWGLLAVALGGYALVPELFWNTAFLHERLVAFLVPALMLACEPRRSNGLSRLTAPLTLGICGSGLRFFRCGSLTSTARWRTITRWSTRCLRAFAFDR
jgi:hypothetical protein